MSSKAVTGNLDTIVALATPQGVGAIGIIRLSGKEAISIANKVFYDKDLAKVPSHSIQYGTIRDNDKLIDEVLVSVFKEPKSYTKENVVEISCHGSNFILQSVIKLLVREGARLAGPGEFTKRAFLHGKFDLAQAEAVADLIAADSEASHLSAISQMRGGFSNDIKRLRDRLIDFASMIELELDFSEEDVEFASRDDLKKLISELLQVIDHLLDSFDLGNVIKNGVPTVIAGKPNSGKSTLLNALLNEEKAIVSDIAGTTRDFIEDEIHIEGITFRFIDTAGIREARDKIEQMGIARTKQKMREASLILYLFDLKSETIEEIDKESGKLDKLGIPYIKLGNKTDLAPKELLAGLKKRDFIFISAKSKINLEELKKQLIEFVNLDKIRSENTIITNTRHYESLFKVNSSLKDVLSGIEKGISGDLLAMDIRQTIHFLGEITGEITTDDLLSNIFSRFCIGK
ncbi:tRNA uridine-5-carboxymethylaminomethyl(34) synthesis GTPase MnmE [Bacteroidota bacterium]